MTEPLSSQIERVAVALDPMLPPGVSRVEAAQAIIDALHAPPSGAELISAERVRQIVSEGHTPEHDQTHQDGSLAAAGVAYATTAIVQLWRPDLPTGEVPKSWPFDPEEWKPQDAVRNLVRAGALIAAEIDRSRGNHG